MTQIKVGSDYSGVGAFDYAMKRISKEKSIKVKNIFACDFDEYARISYIANHGTKEDLDLVKSKEHSILAKKVGKIILSNKIEYNEQELEVLKEANEFAKHFSFYYPFNVYDREIPKESLDIYMTSPPCQSFSIAGKRKGKNDDQGKGILFFNSLQFIRENKPKHFIFENVEGLLSDDKPEKSTAKYGKTFSEWINYLGGLSVNGLPTLLPYDEAVPYHIYFRVLNSKDYGVPQNRKRVFIIGVSHDAINNFTFPKELFLEKRLKNVLEPEVHKKYFLSEKMLEGITFTNKKSGEIANLNKGGERGSIYSSDADFMSCLSATDYKQPKQILIDKVGFINQDTQAGAVYSDEGLAPILSAGTHGYAQGYIEIGTWRTQKDGEGFRKMEDNLCPTIQARAREDGSGQPVIKIHSNTNKGYELFTEEDSLNLDRPTSKTRRGRVGVGVAQTLDTKCNQGVISSQEKNYIIRRLTPLECFRLQAFPDSHVENCQKQNISDSQLYKQAGNSITVDVLYYQINKLIL